ncbi:MAG: hypothetical protein LBU32_22775 [Clostridiales bacterium]|nr:hypothetical protein [Clostridiales bacterium]
MPDGRKGFVFGRRSSGSFDARTLCGEKSGASISCGKLKPLIKRAVILTVRRKRKEGRIPLPPNGI